MPSPSSTIQKFLDQNKDNPQPDLLITFPSGTHISAPATKSDKPSTSQQPTFSVTNSCLRTHVPGAKYIAVSLDLDAPSPSLHLLSPILHYLHTDLTAEVVSPFAAASAATTTAPPQPPQPSSPLFKTDTATDTWVRLAASTVATGGKGTLEKPLASWLAPAPPGFSAPHRYVFLVWEQPEKMTGERVRAKLGFGSKGEPGLLGKTRFDVEGFVRKCELGDVVAGTWMVVGS